MKDLDRQVSMICSVCGNDQFAGDENDSSDNATYQCSDCGKIYTKAELIAENEEKINAAVEEIADEAVAEIEKQLKKAFKKWR